MAGHSDADLVEALAHVGYEMWMMTQAAARLGSGECDEVATNAYIESMLIHARALTDFFIVVKERQLAGDIKRTDFAREWVPEPGDAADRLRSTYSLHHKYVAHLTWDRVDASQPAWFYWTIAADIVMVADQWCGLLIGSPELHGAFRPYVVLSLDLLAVAQTFDPDANKGACLR